MFELTFPADTVELIKEYYDKSEKILEYGSGGSTLYALQNSNKGLLSVESDKEWIEKLKEKVASNKLPGTFLPFYVNVGPTKEWGRPSDMSFMHLFPNYAIEPLLYAKKQSFDYDLVLIDGRFRVACMIAVMAMAHRKISVIIDDYTDRNYKDVIEKYISPDKIVGRAAHFTVEKSILNSQDVIENFSQFYNSD